MNHQLRTWLKEGRCPQCGELGSLDPSGGAYCSTHGVYAMVLEKDLPVIGPPPKVKNYPGLLECWRRYQDVCAKKTPSFLVTTVLLEKGYLHPFPEDLLNEGFEVIEKQNAKVQVTAVNPGFFLSLWSSFSPQDLKNTINREEREELLRHNYFGNLRETLIIADDKVPYGTLYLMSNGDLTPNYTVIFTQESKNE